MLNEQQNNTTQQTQWTGSLLEDLFSSLSGGRDDATVRAFAQELMNDNAKRAKRGWPEHLTRSDLRVIARIAPERFSPMG